jgi:hypothetical protein
LHWNTEATQIVRAQHGFDACVIGGVATVYEEVFDNPAKF